MESREQVIEKVKKILALAENNPNENEAIAAALKAQKLMAKFNIEKDDLGEEVKEEEIDKLTCIVSGKSQKWRIELALALANNFRCKLYLVDGEVTFYGFKNDVKVCSEVFNSLYKIGVKLSDKAKREKRSEYGTAKGVRNSFCSGFVKGIRSELEKQCTALMIVVPKEVEDSYADMSKNMKNTTYKLSHNNFDSRAYQSGFQSGKDAVRQRGIEGGH